MDDDEFQIEVRRGRIEKGKTLSRAAADALGAEMLAWVLGRLIAHWETTNVPPTRVVVKLKVEIQ